jgi:hypothetical protein
MKTRMRRNVRKNNKSKKNKLKKYGVARGQRHFDDPNLDKAYRYIYDYSEHSSEWLNDYLKDSDKNSADYQKVKEINDMLVKGHKLMKLGYDKFEELMTTE